MNHLLVFFATFALVFHHASGSHSSSEENVSIDTAEEAALVEKLFLFLDGLEGWTVDPANGLFESGVYFTDDGIFCDTAVGCAKSLADMPSVFGTFPPLLDIVFENIIITAVNPSLAIPSVTFIADEVLTVEATGCAFTIPSRSNIVYFDGDLVSQYHVAGTFEDTVFTFFEGLAPDAPSCN